ncbi:amino acid transporter [Malaciobacter halophilus]|uniref:Amino acid transporter n=1 Tax=Malaciobacter halophilus TaxID=197482 RepID=A0A2N1J2Y0_9BACT|nr:LysE family transporter [Malaciobacter halophilus]AXH10640.1 transporter, LysE family [Malaciobacter halophilus]PKI80917.1 amino acid transporter [Malaciobacter halophilus]
MIELYTKGFFVTLSLIVAIGAQNAYILKLGLLRQYVFPAVILCTFFDLILISLGVFGLGFFIKGNQSLINIIAIIGIVFLSSYAFLSFKKALKSDTLLIEKSKDKKSFKEVLSLLLVFTFLNPHTYLDTVLLIGGIGANIINFDEKLAFLFGTVSGSFVWFFSLGFFSKFLIPLFKKSITWKILDTIIGIVMLIIAYSLIELISF